MRFVVMSDTHFYAPGTGKDGMMWHRTLHSRSEELAETLVESVRVAEPEFVIHCGDFTGLCEMDNFEYGKGVMDRLGCPWYVTPGNHDTWYPGVRGALGSLYDQSNGQCHYARDIKGVRFLFLDTCHWAAKDGSTSAYLDKELYDTGQIEGLYMPTDQIAWLRAELAEHADRKVVLISHVPLGYKDSYPRRTWSDGTKIPTGRVDLAKMLEDVVNRAEMLDGINGCDNIIAAFAGHWHINDVTVKNGMMYCQAAALREWPFEFRVVELNDNEMRITTHGLNNTNLAKDSYVPERENDWVAGEADDREFVWRFRQ